MDEEKVEIAIVNILKEIGEDVTREGIKATPSRVTRLYKNLFYRYRKKLVVMDEDERNSKTIAKAKEVIPITIFNSNEYQEMLVREVKGFSHCEHHMTVFPYTCYVGIIPDAKLLGLNKIDRIVKYFGSGLQIQERLTQEIAEWIDKNLEPKGVTVMMFGNHFCSQLQGDDGKFTTSAVRGEFLKPTKGVPLQEFLSIVNNMRQ